MKNVDEKKFLTQPNIDSIPRAQRFELVTVVMVDWRAKYEKYEF